MPSIEQERCSQCNEAGPLLTCDDPVEKGTSSSKPRFCNKCMIGKSVKVFWPVDERWYPGKVEEYNAISGEHLLRYPDGDTEWVKIGDLQANMNAPQPTTSGGDGIDPNGSMSAGTDATDPPSTAPDDRKWETAANPYHYGGGPYHPPGVFPPQAGMPYGPGMPSYGMYGPGSGAGPGGYGGHPIYTGGPYGASLGHHDLKHEDDVSPTASTGDGRRKSGPKPWTKEEDSLLLNLVHTMQWPMKWTVVAQSLPDRTGKQCRERYVNHLNPRLKNTDWTPVEDATIFHLYNTMGSHWAKMSKIIPGRTDNGIKNRFHNIRRQYEREDTHRLRLSSVEDFPDEIRLDRLRKFPEHLSGKSANLWDMKSVVGVLAAQSVLGTTPSTRSNGRFGPFRQAQATDICVRCGLLVPSVHTGSEICTKTGWCQSCARVPPNVSGNLLRECLNLRRASKELRPLIESWEDYFVPEPENAWPFTKTKREDTETDEATAQDETE